MVMTGKQRKAKFDSNMKSLGLVSMTEWVTPERKEEFRAIALNDRLGIIENAKAKAAILGGES